MLLLLMVLFFIVVTATGAVVAASVVDVVVVIVGVGGVVVAVRFIQLLLVMFQQEEDLLPEEAKQEGAVSAKTYLSYLRSFHNLGLGIFVVFLFAVCQVGPICDVQLVRHFYRDFTVSKHTFRL